jgi:hypothetical protein
MEDENLLSRKMKLAERKKIKYLLKNSSGRAHRTRTCNPLIKSQLLCQIELAPLFVATARNFNTSLVAVASGTC